jgi:hypothetical protein
MEAVDGSLLDMPAADIGDIPDDDLLALEERLHVKMEYEPADFSSGEFSSFGAESMFTANDPMAAVADMNHFELDHAMQGLTLPPAMALPPAAPGSFAAPGNELFQLPAGFSWEDEDSTPSSAPVSAPGSYTSNSAAVGERGLARIGERGLARRPSLGNESNDSDSGYSSSASSGQSERTSGGTKKKTRRRSAPDIPGHQKGAIKKEYHNRAERDRTARINTCIQELRVMVKCPDQDKVSILQMSVDRATAIITGAEPAAEQVRSRIQLLSWSICLS